LLFAILVTSILLSAGLGISNIIFKELLLSGIGKQSAIAFFAADTGAECALYWERHTPVSGGVASGSIFPANNASTFPLGSAFCAGTNDVLGKIRSNTVANNGSSVTSNSGVSTFTLELPFVGAPCAFVRVEKSGGSTRIESHGYNIPCTDTGNSRRVERALRYRISSS